MLDAFGLIARALPMSWVSHFGEGFGRTLGWFAFTTNRRIRQRLAFALSDPPKVDALWQDLGCRLFQLFDARRQLAQIQLAPDANKVFLEAKKQGRGVLIATMHLGHWELMAGALSAAGHEITAIAAGPKNGPIYDRLARIRTELKVTTLGPDGGGRVAVETLRSGGVIGLFVDQNTQERGRPMEFLHQTAHTPTTLERLIALTDCVPLFMWNARNEHGQYIVHVEPVDSKNALELVTQRCEALIRSYPAQWVWIHDRWKIRTAVPRARSDNQLV
jgi:lauroyl/myristoyl acyltransferase